MSIPIDETMATEITDALIQEFNIDEGQHKPVLTYE